MNNIKFIIPFLLLALSSCGVVHKTFNKNKSQIDSTSVTKQKSDSLTKVDSSSLHKSQEVNIIRTDSSKEKDNSVITEDITEKHFDTSGKLTKQVDTHRKIENNKQSESVSIANLSDHSRLDSDYLKKSTQVSSQKENKTQVMKVKKEVVKDKDVKWKWWWFPLLGIVILGSRWLWINRGKAKGFFITFFAIIRHFFTGL